MKNKKHDLRQSSTFADKIYSHVKNLILSKKLEADQRITIKEFSEYFNVSITPVREAFQRLMSENLICINARSDIRVIGLPVDKVKEIFELHEALDTYGIEMNLKNFPDALIAELKEMHRQYIKYYKDKNLSMVFKQSLKIHERIWKAYNNKSIYQTLVRAHERLSLFVGGFPKNYYTPDLLEKSYAEHCALIEAIENRDVKLAAEVLTNHWDYSTR
jgi:DNA-binding GntR family transcriptional regulator